MSSAPGDEPIVARGLSKRYGETVAVDSVELTVRAGDIYGYLGPNGAGKTTTMRMLLGLIRPDGGSVRLFGRDPVAEGSRALAGVAGFVEAPAFYGYLSGRKNLEVLAALDGGQAGDEIEGVLGLVGLTNRARDRVSGYSQGMRQRLGIAAALIRKPKLLILDEPANGLDPAGIRDMRALVRRLADAGLTILYSSHLLAEVEEVCNRVAIIDRGRIVYEGGLDELRQTAGERFRLTAADPEKALTVARKTEGLSDLTVHDGAIDFAAAPTALDQLTVRLGQAGIGIRSLVPRTASLEALFFRLTENDGETA